MRKRTIAFQRRAGLFSALAATFLLSPTAARASDANDEPADLVVTAQPRPNLFGTIALPGPVGRWSASWRKVSTEAPACPALSALIAPASGRDRLSQLQYVQAAVDARIGWRSDSTQYGARTYWASASETLSSGLGDDDDRAILKYQALRALGYPRGDLYLMLGRDAVRGEIVMLVARAAGRWWLLEEQGDRVVPAERRAGFEPMASFGAGQTFVHGRPRKVAPIAAPILISANSVRR